MADVHHLWCDSEPEVDTVGIYVENHEGRSREFVIRIHSDSEIWMSEGLGFLPRGPPDF